jgi:hypothetical protein
VGDYRHAAVSKASQFAPAWSHEVSGRSFPFSTDFRFLKKKKKKKKVSFFLLLGILVSSTRWAWDILRTK